MTTGARPRGSAAAADVPGFTRRRSPDAGRAARGAAVRPVSGRPHPAAVSVVRRPRLRPGDLRRDRSAFRELGGRGAHRGRSRRAARRDDQPHLAASAEFQAFQRLGRDSPSADLFITLDKVWPDGEPRDDGRRPNLPAQARGAVLDCHDRRDRRSRNGSGPRSARRTGRSRSTSTSTSPATRALITELARLACVTRRPDRPARCRRVRDQEARHDLLHGRAGDLRVPRLGRRRRRDRSGLVVLPEVHDRYATHERLSGAWSLDLRLRPPGPRASRVRDRRREATREPTSQVARARQFTMLDCHDGIPVRPDLDGILTRPRCRISRPASSAAAAT